MSVSSPKIPITTEARNSRDQYQQRQRIKSALAIALPLVIVSGIYYPVLGFVVLLCMGASVGISFRRGRTWCDFCPRGTFFDTVMSRFSRDIPVPGLLRSRSFRILMLAVLMGVMATQLTLVWGDIPRMGMVFWMLLTVTTIVGILLAIAIRPRAWCAFCPMGSMASWIGTAKQPLSIEPDKCNECGVCARGCPMELTPGSHRADGIMTDGDCLKCTKCIVRCPKQALSFDVRRN